MRKVRELRLLSQEKRRLRGRSHPSVCTNIEGRVPINTPIGVYKLNLITLTSIYVLFIFTSGEV